MLFLVFSVNFKSTCNTADHIVFNFFVDPYQTPKTFRACNQIIRRLKKKAFSFLKIIRLMKLEQH